MRAQGLAIESSRHLRGAAAIFSPICRSEKALLPGVRLSTPLRVLSRVCNGRLMALVGCASTQHFQPGLLSVSSINGNISGIFSENIRLSIFAV